ncbi:major facilitator superfamily domain-containing protein [Desarmillaria tabescens]|uniref:Major facilitator superfamily domain-containing protein n=1 Tax=Armillaria tabescens TaxID=1929756 RepID=A0AA39KEU8_ARMTA|nr:major facilitator superfamily domain-containing protein [Desarmillaria tabescens]KAK0457498.1 major facilitator superfamily domain-containing protein [Desarmillaria tabescens]
MTDSLQDSHDSGSGDSEKSHHSIELDAPLERRVWLKVDLFLLPVIAIWYFLSFLDRTNIGNARIAGLQHDLRITDKQYTTALIVTYASNIAAELPSNLLLRVIGPNYLLPTLLIGWGLATTLQGVVTNYGGLLVCRFFLGVFEGGALPGIVLYLTHFYPRAKMTTRVSAIFATSSVSGAFSGILAYGIIRMDGIGGRSGWRWIFILEGAFSVACGLIGYFLMPRDAMAARFLRPTEREYVASRVAESGGEKFEWREVKKALVAPHVWILSITLFFSGSVLFGLAFFTPSIVQSLGYTAARSQLMSVPPFAAAFALSMMSAYLCDKFHIRSLVCIMTSIITLTGFIVFLTSSSANTRYGSLFLTIPGVYTTTPTLGTWNSTNSAPHVRRATAIAVGFMVASAGGIVSTWLIGSLSTAPKYVLGTKVMVGFSVGMIVGSALCLGYFVQMNERKRGMLRREVKGMDGDLAPTFVYLL